MSEIIENRGRGRPPIPEGERMVPIGITLKPDTMTGLDAIVAATGESRSSIARLAVETFLNNPEFQSVIDAYRAFQTASSSISDKIKSI